MFCLNVTLYVRPERREEFIACIEQNQRGTLETEPLARLYEWGESTTEPNTFHFQEQYDGKEGFDAHQTMPHFQVWEQFAATEPFSKPPEIQFFTTMAADAPADVPATAAAAEGEARKVAALS